MDPLEIDDGIYTKNLPVQGLITQEDFQRRKQPRRCVTVCLGLLCALLLAGNIGQILYYKTITHRSSADPLPPSSVQQDMQRNFEVLQSEHTNLTTGKEQLQTQYGNLQARFSALVANRDQLQSNCSSLQRDKDQLQRSYDNLGTSKSQLQTNYNSLRKDKDQLQTTIETLRRAKEQLQTQHNSLSTALQLTVNKLKAKVKGMLCQSGWQKFDMSCYFVSTLKKNWTESRQACVDQGADLVVMHSRDEQVFVNGILKYGTNAWIGLTDSVEEGTWMWLDGTPVTRTYWQSGQPDSYQGNQDCGEIVKVSPKAQGEWNDDGCFAQQVYICEK